MGLDIVELIMAVEDTFEISVEDSSAERIVTVGDLHAFVLSRHSVSVNGTCLTSHTFYRLRSALVESSEACRTEISPRSQLDLLVEGHQRRATWRKLEDHLGWDLPSLERPKVIRSFFQAAALAAIGFMVSLPALGLVSISQALVGGVGFSFAFAFLLAATRPLTICLPSGVQTVGQAAESLLRLNFSAIERSCGIRSEGEVWTAVKSIVVDQLGVPPRHVTPEARLVDDLGAD